MNTATLSAFLVAVLQDHKALDVVAINVSQLTDIAERLIISSATSKTHARSLADNLLSSAKKAHIPALGIEGETESEWILIDLDRVIIHIMLSEIRDFYSLEKLWQPTELSKQREY